MYPKFTKSHKSQDYNSSFFAQLNLNLGGFKIRYETISKLKPDYDFFSV